mmetsp:Transcript_35529/g.73976  ORF Transcript_35529/g.73976 Transcript_35529/m.73976 type:complete len:126 (-) Transcript_35529:113-490(-)
MSQDGFVDFGPVLMELRSQIHEWLGTNKVPVRYLCGMDHALNCGLLGGYGSRLELVVLGRPSYESGLGTETLPSYHRHGILVLEDEELLATPISAASSTQVRETRWKPIPAHNSLPPCILEWNSI